MLDNTRDPKTKRRPSIISFNVGYEDIDRNISLKRKEVIEPDGTKQHYLRNNVGWI